MFLFRADISVTFRDHHDRFRGRRKLSSRFPIMHCCNCNNSLDLLLANIGQSGYCLRQKFCSWKFQFRLALTVCFKSEMHRYFLLILTPSGLIHYAVGSYQEQQGWKFTWNQIIRVTTSLRRGVVSHETQVLDQGRDPNLALTWSEAWG